MKKIFKLMPVALGMLTLASCSNVDEIEGGNAPIQLKDGQILATVEDAFDAPEGSGTRVGMGEFGSTKTFVWQKGEKAKVYAARNWRTDTYTVDETADNNTKAVFNSTDKVALTDLAYGVYPYEGTLVNEERTELNVELPSVISYAKLANAKYGDKTGTAYKCDRPLFGFAVNQSIKFRYLTSVLRLVVQNAMPVGAKYIVVRSNRATDYLSGSFTADIEDISNEFFEDNTKGAEYDIPELVGDPLDANNWVCVDLTAATSYDNNIYIPIPSQAYEGELSVYVCNSNFNPLTYTGEAAPTVAQGVETTFYVNGDTEDDAAAVAAGTALRTYDADKFFKTTSVYTIGTIVGNATLTCDAKTLEEVNEYLAAMVVDRNVTINFSEQVNSFTKSVWGQTVTSDKLIIPETWTGDYTVTLQFADAAQGINTSAEVADLDGVALAAGDMKAAQVLNKSSLKNVIINVAAATAPVTAELVESASSLTTFGTNINNITLKAGKAAIAAGAGAPAVTDDGAASITLESGTIGTLTPKAATTEIVINGGTVTKLQLTKDQAQTITMTGGAIGTIKKSGVTNTTATTVTVNTSGAAVIGVAELYDGADADKLVYDFNATMDANTVAAADAQQKIYTAAQLLAIDNVATYNYELLADVTIAEDAPFASLRLKKNFDGKNNTITGLTKPLFAEIADDVAVSDLTLKNVDIVPATAVGGQNIGALAVSTAGTSTFTNIIVDGGTIGAANLIAGSASYNVGGLFGAVAGTTTITDCAVKNVTIQGYYNLGGFIGSARGKVVIAKAVDTEFAFVSSEKSTVTIARTFNTTESTDANSGKVGNFIGNVTGEDAEISIGDADYAKAFTDFFTADGINGTALYFSKNVNADSKPYVGMGKHEIGFSTGTIKNGATATTALVLYGAKTADPDAEPVVYYGIDTLKKYAE